MADPIDYASRIPNPFNAFVQGYQGGALIQENRQRQAATQLALQQKAIALQRSQEMNKELTELSQNPSVENIAKLSMKYPEFSENFKRSSDMWSTAQREQKLNSFTPVYAAILNKRPDISAKLLREQAIAQENAGDTENAKGTNVIADMIEKSPESAQETLGFMLSSVMGKDKFIETFSELQKEGRAQALSGSQLSEAESKARKAATEAKYADSQAALGLQKMGADIDKIYSDIDISKESNRIKALDAGIARETNQIKRDELKLKRDKAISDRDQKARDKWNQVQEADQSVANLKRTIQRLRENPELRDVIGSYEGNDYWWTVRGDDEKDAIALIEQLGSEQFNAAIKQLGSMSGLTEVEGKALTAAAGNIRRDQSEAQFLEQLDIMEKNADKMNKRIQQKFGTPTRGVSLESSIDGANARGEPPPPVPSMPSGFRVLGRE